MRRRKKRNDKKKGKTTTRQNNRTGNVESFETISCTGWWEMNASGMLRASCTHPWRWADAAVAASLLNGGWLFVPVKIESFFCLRNVYVWTGALSHDSRKRKRKISYSFFLSILSLFFSSMFYTLFSFKKKYFSSSSGFKQLTGPSLMIRVMVIQTADCSMVGDIFVATHTITRAG